MKRLLRKQQRGAVALIVALSLVVMIGFLGLVVDLGRLYINKSELSNAADACALAAARELGVQPIASSLERAVAAGQLVGGRNNADFQGNPVTVRASDVTFSATLASGYRPSSSADPATAKYVRCELPRSGILPWFMQVLGIGAQTVSAQAVASQQASQTSCGLPIGMCQQSATSCPKGGVPDAYGFCKGEWYGSKVPAGGGYTGSFNWIDYDPPNGGAPDLEKILTGAGQCSLEVGKKVGQSGVTQSLRKAWNTRFGIYMDGSLTASNATPDFTGYAYTATTWTSKYNAFSGSGNNFKEMRQDFEPFQSDGAGLGDKQLARNRSSKATHNEMGGDRRVAVVPIVDCKGWSDKLNKQQTNTIKAFACVLMLHPMTDPKDETFLEYLGLADEPGNPCVTQGMPGSSANVGPRVPGLVR